MDAKIDWLAFSVPLADKIPEHGWRWGDIVVALSQQVNIPFGAWEEGRGHAPYNHTAAQPDKGIYVSWSGKFTHCHVEYTGTGCHHLRETGALNEVLTKMQNRVTRLDVATDFRTEILPSEFVEKRNTTWFKASASYHTKSGDTEYVGSRKSELMGRVYRYNPPHPRSDLLRVEHETKRKTAKASVRYMLQYGVEQLQRELGTRFAWSHPVWPDGTAELPTLSRPSQTREEAKTDIWLRTQCAAAFKKLVKTGAISDPAAYLKEVFGIETLSQNANGDMLAPNEE